MSPRRGLGARRRGSEEGGPRRGPPARSLGPARGGPRPRGRKAPPRPRADEAEAAADAVARRRRRPLLQRHHNGAAGSLGGGALAIDFAFDWGGLVCVGPVCSGVVWSAL